MKNTENNRAEAPATATPHERRKKQSIRPTVRLALSAVFCALAYITVYLPIGKVAFLTLDLKDTVIALAAMLLGPEIAVSLAVAVPLLEMTVSDTGLYGFLMNSLSSLSFTVPAALLYRRRKTLGGAVAGLSTGVLTVTAVMMGANLLITPFYTGMKVSAVRGLILPLLLPFNFTKAALNAALVMFFYKPLSNALKQAKLLTGLPVWRMDRRSVGVLVVSLIVVALALVTFFFALDMV